MGKITSTPPTKPKGAGRWWRLPPELHPKAEAMLAEMLTRYPPERLRYVKGLLMGNITNQLLHPKDSKWGWRTRTSKALKKARAKIKEMRDAGIPHFKKDRIKAAGGSLAGDGKQNEYL